jgi:hypothetical protein
MKVVLFERADQNLDVPQLTITVYAVYYFSLMLGTFTFSRIRLHLPKPAEPETAAQSRHLYIISLVGGVTGALGVVGLDLAGPEASHIPWSWPRSGSLLLPAVFAGGGRGQPHTSHGRPAQPWMGSVVADAYPDVYRICRSGAVIFSGAFPHCLHDLLCAWVQVQKETFLPRPLG